MVKRDIIVLGASAGGVDAFMQLVSQFPKNLPATLLMVIHLAPDGVSALPKILNRVGQLPADHARHGEPIRPGRIYVAPPDHHMLVQADRIHLVAGPRENGSRPAIDPLFRTAARVYRERVVGVVLSGLLDDGTEGLSVIKAHGGITVAQDPEEALYASMPRSAIENVDVDYVLTLSEIVELLVRLASEPGGDGNMVENHESFSDVDPDIVEQAMDGLDQSQIGGKFTKFTCPECGGVLKEIDKGKIIQYRCHTGHGFSMINLQSAKARDLEKALWTAVQALEDNATLSRRLAERMKDRGNHTVTSKRFEQRALEADERANLIRQLILREDQIMGMDKLSSDIHEKKKEE